VLVASGFVLLALLVLFAFFDVMQELGSLGRNNTARTGLPWWCCSACPGICTKYCRWRR
jgi:hypothetical protein